MDIAESQALESEDTEIRVKVEFETWWFNYILYHY